MNTQATLLLLDITEEEESTLSDRIRLPGTTLQTITCFDSYESEMKRTRPEAIVVRWNDALREQPNWRALIRAQSLREAIPLIAVLDSAESDAEEAFQGCDDWVTLNTLDELPRRIAGAASRIKAGEPSGIGPKFLGVMIHDLRTPLNVINLTLRVIEQTLSRGEFDIAEDLGYLRDNSFQIEKMLSLAGDYCALIESRGLVTPDDVDLRRFLEAILEDRAWQNPARPVMKRLEIEPGCPSSVWIDPTLGRMAILHALGNAAGAAGVETPVVIKASGDAASVTIAIELSQHPKFATPFVLRPDIFERVRGTASERRGLDLAYCARVTRLMGGESRLDVAPDKSTAIVLNWPTQPAPERAHASA